MSLYRPQRMGDFGSLWKAVDSAFFDGAGSSGVLSSFQPRVDVVEKRDQFEVKADLPGVKKEDISLEFDNENTLTINGKIERETESTDSGNKGDDKNGKGEPEHRVWHRERLVGEFSRSFGFPGNINKDAVRASLDNGILSVVIPKREEATAKRIAIE